GAHAHAELRLLASDQAVTKAARLLQGGDAHHRVAAAELGRPGGAVAPLDVAEQVVDRALGEALAVAPGDRGDVGMRIEEGTRDVEPADDDLAVAVDELDVVESGLELEQASPAVVARARRGE